MRPAALERKLRQLAGEALEKVGGQAERFISHVELHRTPGFIPFFIFLSRLCQRLHARAAFYADKLVTLGKSPLGLLRPLSQQRRAEDVLLLAKAFHQGREHRRAVHTLERHGLLAFFKVGKGKKDCR